MKCTKCDANLTKEDVYCSSCGKKSKQSEDAGNKSKLTPKVIIIGLVIIFIIGWFFMAQREVPPSEDSKRTQLKTESKEPDLWDSVYGISNIYITTLNTGQYMDVSFQPAVSAGSATDPTLVDTYGERLNVPISEIVLIENPGEVPGDAAFIKSTQPSQVRLALIEIASQDRNLMKTPAILILDVPIERFEGKNSKAVVYLFAQDEYVFLATAPAEKEGFLKEFATKVIRANPN